MVKHLAVKISYDGSCFHGWQCQANALSVQESLEKSWRDLTGEKIHLLGSSRTDAGVHADAMVANFSTKTKIPSDRVHLAWNSLLPEGLAVIAAKEVAASFNARFDSLAKHYSYYLYLDRVRPTYLRHCLTQVPEKLDLALMEEALPYLIGERNFACFMDQGSPVRSTVRRILALNLEAKTDKILEINVLGDGFLYHMVRIIAGTLLYVANGKIKLSDLACLINQADRTKVGKTMPAGALFLRKVFYPVELFGLDGKDDLDRLIDKLKTKKLGD